MKLTEEEVMMLEDMKGIESIQEEIESYLIEKYDLENLEEGNFFQWLANPLTRFKQHYITRDGDIKYAYKDTKLMKKKANGETLTPAEQKRVKYLKGLETRVKDAVDDEKESKIDLRNAKREEKTKKKDVDNERKTFNKKKELDLDKSAEHDMYTLIYGDGMSERAARKLMKKKRKDYESRQKDVLSGKEKPSTDRERDLVASKNKTIGAAHDYVDARFEKGQAKESHDNIKRKIKNMRDE